MIIEILKIIVPILTAIIGLFTNKKIESRSMKKAQIFKQIRNEYLEDKIIGYYFFQSFLGLQLPKNQIDFILNSENAYTILKIIKNSNGKYTFDGKKFKSKLSKIRCVSTYICYFISSMILLFYFVFYKEIREFLDIQLYIIIYIFLIAIFMPILINSIIHISEIRDVRMLEKITSKRKRIT
ncbi:MAG: hypothetical protein PUA64_10515 [Treponema sp.]|nr:hypothetical protein [Treponema sp.]